MEPTRIDDPTLRLHAEELTLEKGLRLDRAALVAREVVSTAISLDVPLLYEELSIVERPVRERAAEVAPIAAPQRLTVRLSRERAYLNVALVEYERVTVGTREVVETVRVTAPLAYDELTVERRDGGIA